MRALSIGTVFGHRLFAVHNRSIQYNILTLAEKDVIISLAQLVESLTLNTGSAGLKPRGVTSFFYKKIIFLNLFYLLLYPSRKFLNFRTFSPFSQVVEIADNGCIW